MQQSEEDDDLVGLVNTVGRGVGRHLGEFPALLSRIGRCWTSGE